MTWQPELDELRLREAHARRMGGAEKVERQRAGGRLTVRERIARLADPGSFRETGAIAGKAEYDAEGNLVELVPSNSVFGRAEIAGRPVVLLGDDFTVRGGSADATIREKPLMAERMAHEFRLPIVRVIEGSGGGGSVKTIETTGRANLPGGVGGGGLFHYTTLNLSQVPVVALGLGSVAGLGAARLAASHYSVMTKDTSAMFVAGPPVVARLGQTLSKAELGGWEIQTRSGAVDHAADKRGGGLHLCPPLPFLPALLRVRHAAGRAVRGRPRPARREALHRRPAGPPPSLPDAPDRRARLDRNSFFEMGRMFGRPIITGLARLGGCPVAVMASDPFFYGGSWTADACAKLIRFLDLAETFHLPVVYLMDCPGFMVGLEAEKAATIRLGVRAMAAMGQTTVPWCTVIVRNAFGVAGAATARPGGCRCATPGCRRVGDPCRWRAASRRPTAPTSPAPRTPPASSPRSRTA
jgi:acetyl-CoA carboxylase carboxyltransferase component